MEAKTRKVIAGSFIESLLDEKTLSITRMDPVEIVESTGNGSMSAYDVVEAFSKRAAYGHQMVRSNWAVLAVLTINRASTSLRWALV